MRKSRWSRHFGFSSIVQYSREFQMQRVQARKSDNPENGLERSNVDAHQSGPMTEFYIRMAS